MVGGSSLDSMGGRGRGFSGGRGRDRAHEPATRGGGGSEGGLAPPQGLAGV